MSKEIISSFITRIVNSSAVQDDTDKSYYLDQEKLEESYQNYFKELFVGLNFLETSEKGTITRELKELSFLVIDTLSTIDEIKEVHLRNF